MICVLTLMALPCLAVSAVDNEQAHDDATPIESLVLRWYYDSVSIIGYAEFLEDEANTYSFEEVLKANDQQKFKPFKATDVNQGINNSTYWFKLSLKNPRANGMTWAIHPQTSYADHMDIWVKNDGGQWKHKTQSDHNPFSKREISYRLMNATFKLPKGKGAEVYIKLSTAEIDLRNINVYISGQSNLRDILAKEYLFYGVYFGLFFALVLLIVSIWFYAKTHSYLYYFYFLSYLLCNIVMWLSLNGFSFQFIWPDNPALHNQSLHVFYLAAASFAFLFSRELLNTKVAQPFIDKILLGLISLYICAIVLRLFGVAYEWVFYISLFSLISLISQPLLAWRCYQKGSTYLLLYIIAWVPFSISMLLMLITTQTGWTFDTTLLAQFSVLFECLMLIIATLSKMSYRSAKLERLTLQDPLTQLGNRRRLEEHIIALRKDTHQALYWLLLIDIDHFKNINDTYGHSVGDDVLVKLAKMMKKVCRNDDVAIRWGGEEFLLLVKVDDAAMAIAIAERVRAKFNQSPMTVNNQTLTYSLSVGLHPLDFNQDDPLSIAVECADQALYHAKKSGRNQVVVFDAIAVNNRVN
ncbi:sensor domain-containing diguanylate cyclase [Algibacillus agarilyticus]|uniref:sensor domain-containing diguanylate cyclase n=1 Tax=Algibacillus agarilyticus TaxID=2234133 RepID=UPI0018E540F1|nr:diguanylate cyclase [Algibacillus agarilyticus]